MAKRAATIATKKKVVRVSRGESYYINKKYYGEEPTWGVDGYKFIYNAFNWYNTMAEEDEVRLYINDYLKSIKADTEVKKLARVPFMRVPRGSAAVVRIHSRGGPVDAEMLDRAKDNILECITKYSEQEKKDETNVVRLSVQDHVTNKVSEFIGEIEEILDKGALDFSMYTSLQSNSFPAALSTRVADYYRPIQQEIADAIAKKDPQLVEAYASYTKPQMKAKLALYTGIVDDCDKHSGNLRKARKPRKKKAVSPAKKLKVFQYQKEDAALKISSVNPESVLGAQELWTFNTKSKVLSVFRARGPAGLEVNRTAIGGYDVDTSMSKKIGRKTDEVLKSVTTSGKVALRKLFDTINTDQLKFVDRLNSNTILLKVVR
jgi:D-alanyl-D-alanine dipeptidase